MVRKHIETILTVRAMLKKMTFTIRMQKHTQFFKYINLGIKFQLESKSSSNIECHITGTALYKGSF